MKNKGHANALRFKNPFINIKYGIQRMTKGYCDADVLNITDWFCAVVPPMLRQHAKDVIGCPANFLTEWLEGKKIDPARVPDEEYDAIDQAWHSRLHQMADDFENANYYCWLYEDGSFEKGEEFKEKAIKEFSKWFFCFWQ